VYLGVVSPLEDIVEDLKTLPPDRLEMAASFIRRLKPISQAEREAALARTFGCLSPEEGRRNGKSHRRRLCANQ
jgi:hypothetical protein